MSNKKINKNETQTTKLNRFRSMRPRGGLFWCNKCDRELVSTGGKCSACGALSGHKTRKHSEFK